MLTRTFILIILTLPVLNACRSLGKEEQTTAQVTEPDTVSEDSVNRLEGDFFEPNNNTHKIVFNGQTLCLYHGSDTKDQYKIYRGEVTLFKDSVNIFFRNENHPDMNLKIIPGKGNTLYLRGTGTDIHGRTVNYNFTGTRF